jgi:enoyl-CoA hydratase/carnithine racemase
MSSNLSSNFQYLKCEGPVTTITLNRPECHSALDREVSAELNAAVKEISDDRGWSHRDPSRAR